MGNRLEVMMGDEVEIRVLSEQDLEAFLRLRLEGLEREPYAFGRSYEEAKQLAPESYVPRLRSMPEGNFVVGAFVEGRMVGLSGFVRHEGLKERHKGGIWGVYVTASARGRGIARAVLTHLLDRVKGYPGMEQVTLSVATVQESARRLYDSLGFEIFGMERHALKVGGVYVDEEHRVLWLHRSPET